MGNVHPSVRHPKHILGLPLGQFGYLVGRVKKGDLVDHSNQRTNDPLGEKLDLRGKLQSPFENITTEQLHIHFEAL